MTICTRRVGLLSLSALLLGACVPTRPQVSPPKAPPAAQRAPTNRLQSAPAYAPAPVLSCKRLDDWVAEIGPLKTNDNQPLDPTLAQGLSWQLLVEDERFVPIFGKPYDQMTQRELTDIGTNTVDPCVMQNQTHLNKNYQNTISNIFRMHTMMMQGLQRARDGHAEFDRMTAEVATLKQTQEDSNRLDLMRRRASLLVINAPGKSAEQFFFAVAQYGSLRSATISRPIIEQELTTASGLKGLNVLIDREAFVQLETERDAKQGVSSDWHTLLPRLHARVHELAVTVAAEETAKYRAFMDATGYGPSSLSKAAAYDRDVFATNTHVIKLRNSEGGQNTRPEFDAFNQLRDQYFVKIMANREKALAEQTPDILARVARASTPKELGALYADAVPTDQKESQAGKAIGKAVDARFDQLLPFNKLSGGLYLSVLYLKDRETIHRLDQDYLSGVREAGGGWEDKAAAWAREMDPKTRGKPVQDAWTGISMLEVVLSSYLYSYGTSYASCLRPGGYTTITITHRTPDLVTRMNGLEVARQLGAETQTIVRINNEFVPIFNGIDGGGAASVAALDLFSSNHKIWGLINGVEQMMKTYPCNHPKMQQMEKSMRELYNEKH